MNIFRSFSITTRLVVTFLMTALLPVVVFVYVLLTGITVHPGAVLFVSAIAILNAIVTAMLVATSINTPTCKIMSSLQSFQIKKTAISISDSGNDDLSQISEHLNRLFSTWNQEIIDISKKQINQDKKAELNETQLNTTEKQLELTRSLLKVAQTLNTTFDFQSNLKTILDEAITTLNIQWASILIIDREKHEMQVAGVRGIEKSLLDDLVDADYPAIRLKPHEGLAGQVIKDGLPLIANKGFKDPRFKQFSEFKGRDEKVASLLCAPIMTSNGTVLGVINLINRISPPVFRNEDIPFVQDICILASLVIERNRMYQNLFKDKETGLDAYNVWRGQFAEECTRATRFAQPLTMVVLEIDDFKKLTEQTNVDFGIKITIECGQEVSRKLRNTDKGASVQERFLILLPNTDIAGAVFLTGRIKEAFENKQFNFGKENFKITSSAGIACYPYSCSDAKELVSLAVKALSDAKEAGGNRAVVFDSDRK